jgi:predicted NUDIX family NTP pyrophosphohydrolase
MPKISAGVLLYRQLGDELQVLLVHPGGPFWARKDLGAWSIPKGEVEAGEDPLDTARRELTEETGLRAVGELTPLTPVTQKGGKTVLAWAAPGDGDPTAFKSNTFTMEWPRGSGRMQEFPEVDRAEWFGVEEAVRRILPAQAAFVLELQTLIAENRERH